MLGTQIIISFLTMFLFRNEFHLSFNMGCSVVQDLFSCPAPRVQSEGKAWIAFEGEESHL